MAEVLFKRIEDSSLLDNYPFVDGSYYITKDGKSYVDYDDKRVPIGGTPDKQMNDRSTNPVENGIIKRYVDELRKEFEEFKKILTTSIELNGPPVKTGRIVGGKEEWIIKTDLGYLPNNTEKRVKLPIDMTTIQTTKGFICWGVSNNNEVMTIPRYNQNISSAQILISDNNYVVSTIADLSRFHAYAEFYFTYNN